MITQVLHEYRRGARLVVMEKIGDTFTVKTMGKRKKWTIKEFSAEEEAFLAFCLMSGEPVKSDKMEAAE